MQIDEAASGLKDVLRSALRDVETLGADATIQLLSGGSIPVQRAHCRGVVLTDAALVLQTEFQDTIIPFAGIASVTVVRPKQIREELA